jgi:regulator of sirC expression with transglutaminase-like and TPR domain
MAYFTLSAAKIKMGIAILSAMGLACWAPVLQADDTDSTIATLAPGDALDLKLQTKESLQLYLDLEKNGETGSELLYRIAREYAELMLDTDSKAEKQRLGEVALSYAKRAVAADPTNANAYLSLSICYGRLAEFQDNRKKLEYAREVKSNAEEALRLNPKLDYADYVLGAWNYEMANLNIVMRDLAVVAYGKLPEASNEKAVEYLSQAIALAPQRVSHHIELGRTYVAMGKKDLARSELETGLALPSIEKDDEVSKARGREVLAKLNKPPLLPIFHK